MKEHSRSSGLGVRIIEAAQAKEGVCKVVSKEKRGG